ncbi:hypothetical protein D3C72_699850 [compost metagenome]
MNKPWLIALLVAGAIVPAAPASAIGLQYGMEAYSVRGDADFNEFFSDDQRARWGATTPGFGAVVPLHTFTLWDESGILLAALGTATAEDVARREALERARQQGKKPGDVVTYSYQQRDVVSGNIYFRYAFGQAHAGDFSFDGTTYNTYDTLVDVKLVELGVYRGHEFFGYPTMVKFEGLARFITFSGGYTRSDGSTAALPSPPGGRTNDTSAVALPLSYGPVFAPLPGLTVTPLLGFDLWSPIPALVQKSNLGFQYAVEADYRPFRFVHATAFARGLTSSLLDGANYNSFSLGAHAGVRF